MGAGVEPAISALAGRRCHAFVLGLLGLPNSALIVLFGGAQHLLLARRWTALRHGLLGAYRNGKSAAPLLWVDWERLWERPLEQVRAELGVWPVRKA